MRPAPQSSCLSSQLRKPPSFSTVASAPCLHAAAARPKTADTTSTTMHFRPVIRASKAQHPPLASVRYPRTCFQVLNGSQNSSSQAPKLPLHDLCTAFRGHGEMTFMAPSFKADGHLKFVRFRTVPGLRAALASHASHLSEAVYGLRWSSHGSDLKVHPVTREIGRPGLEHSSSPWLTCKYTRTSALDESRSRLHRIVTAVAECELTFLPAKQPIESHVTPRKPVSNRFKGPWATPGGWSPCRCSPWSPPKLSPERFPQIQPFLHRHVEFTRKCKGKMSRTSCIYALSVESAPSLGHALQPPPTPTTTAGRGKQESTTPPPTPTTTGGHHPAKGVW